MNLKIVGILWRKELLDLMRDRRTLISLVIAPMLIGPGIMSVMNFYVARNARQAKVERYKVGVRQEVTIPGLLEALQRAGLETTAVAAPRQAVEKKEVTFGIEVAGNPEQPRLRFYSDNSEMTSNMARARVSEALDGLWSQRIRNELARRNLPGSVAEPFARESINVAQPRKMTGAFIGRLIGFMMLIFLFNGAMYSAVDATAGEKERRTLEILLASAAGRTEIVAAKVLTAMVTSFGTTVLSIASYAIALAQSASSGRSGSGMEFPSDPATLLMIALLILPVAVMAASFSIAAATPAKSTREAMSYLTPGLFIVMFLGMVTFITEGQANPLISLIPFANFSQMLREVMSGEWTMPRYLMTLGSNLIYSAIAIALAVRSFTNEKILFRT